MSKLISNIKMNSNMIDAFILLHQLESFVL